MLSIQSSAPKKCTPNLLPAKISHDGPINDTQRYWTPQKDENDTSKSHAYFRGRHLHGTSLPLPDNYTGAVLHITDKLVPKPANRKRDPDDDEEEDEEDDVEVKIAEKVGEFEEVVVWGHGGPVDENEDAYVRGMREWIGFAEAMHGVEDEGEDGDGDKKMN